MNPFGPIKDAIDLVKTLHRIDVLEKLNDVYSVINELIRKEGEREIELKKANLRVAELERHIHDLSKTQTQFSLVWKIRDDDTLDGPFSPTAWGERGALVLLRCYDSDPRCLWFRDAEPGRNYSVPIDFLNSRRVYTESEMAHFRTNSCGPRAEAIEMRRPNRLDGLL